MSNGRHPLLLIPWALTCAYVVRFARRAAPLGLDDEVGYQIVYWAVVLSLALALAVAGYSVIGKSRLVHASALFVRFMRWPRPVRRIELLLLVIVIVWVWGAAPGLLWLLLPAMQVGDAPFSRVEGAIVWTVMPQLAPYVSRDEAPWVIAAIVATFWLAVSALLGFACAPLARRTHLSPLGAAIVIALVTHVSFALLRLLRVA